MSKTEKLTKEQEAQIPIYKKKWFDIGSSCEPADRKTAEEAISKMYKIIGKDCPKFIWVESPAVGCLVLHKMKKKSSLGDSLGDSLRDSLWDSLRDSLWDSLRDSLGDSLEGSLRDSLGGSLWGSLRDSLWGSLRDSLGDSLGDSLWGSLRNSLWGSLEGSLRGQECAYWVCFYQYCSEIVNVKYREQDQENLNVWDSLVKSMGWWFPYEGTCICCERPKTIHWETNRANPRLHCENGPALEYRDGYKVYCWHGLRVKEELIEKPIMLEQIDNEQNAEIRRIMLERYGTTKYILDSKLEPIAEDSYGKLYKKEVKQDEAIVMVPVHNSTPEPDGTIKEYWLRVQPDCRPMLENGNFGEPQELTPRNAIASTFGLRGEQYDLVKET